MNAPTNQTNCPAILAGSQSNRFDRRYPATHGHVILNGAQRSEESRMASPRTAL